MNKTVAFPILCECEYWHEKTSGIEHFSGAEVAFENPRNCTNLCTLHNWNYIPSDFEPTQPIMCHLPGPILINKVPLDSCILTKLFP